MKTCYVIYLFVFLLGYFFADMMNSRNKINNLETHCGHGCANHRDHHMNPSDCEAEPGCAYNEVKKRCISVKSLI